jgi:hypothetical protein
MKNPETWNPADLHHHLEHALALELWTIPVYLTALYSIKGLRNTPPHNYPSAAKILYSVVVQEMLHIELVCNISNALGWTPRFHRPSYSDRKWVPFIHPKNEYLPADLHGYSAIPQALGKDSLRLFCAIELPHPKKEIVWEEERSYDSILEMYEALKIGIPGLWDKCYVGHERNTKQKSAFQEYHNTNGRNHGFSQPVTSVETALKAIDAIVEQGEGADSLVVPPDYRPPHSADPLHDAGWFKGNLSHYQKFRLLMHHSDTLPHVYEVTNHDAENPFQKAMELSFSNVIQEMEHSFTESDPEMSVPFWTKMYEFTGCIIDVWESGACPRFDW